MIDTIQNFSNFFPCLSKKNPLLKPFEKIWADLKPDSYSSILKYLDSKDIINLSFTSKKIFTLLNEQIFKFKKNPPYQDSHFPTYKKIREFIRRRAFNELNFTMPDFLSNPTSIQSRYIIYLAKNTTIQTKKKNCLKIINSNNLNEITCRTIEEITETIDEDSVKLEIVDFLRAQGSVQALETAERMTLIRQRHLPGTESYLPETIMTAILQHARPIIATFLLIGFISLTISEDLVTLYRNATTVSNDPQLCGINEEPILNQMLTISGILLLASGLGYIALRRT